MNSYGITSTHILKSFYHVKYIQIKTWIMKIAMNILFNQTNLML